MGWFDKYCEKYGKKVDKNTAPQRFSKYFCSEGHAEEIECGNIIYYRAPDYFGQGKFNYGKSFFLKKAF